MSTSYLRKTTLVVLPLVLLILFTLVTNPYKLPIFLIPVPLALAGWFIFEATRTTLAFYATPKKAKLLATISTTIILLVLLLQSIGQLHIRDFLLLLILLAGLAFYLRHFNK